MLAPLVVITLALGVYPKPVLRRDHAGGGQADH